MSSGYLAGGDTVGSGGLAIYSIVNGALVSLVSVAGAAQVAGQDYDLQLDVVQTNGTTTTLTATIYSAAGGGALCSGTQVITATITNTTSALQNVAGGNGLVNNTGGAASATMATKAILTYSDIAAGAFVAPNATALFYSRQNWVVGATQATTVDAGASVRVRFTGASCGVYLNMAAPLLPGRFKARVDGGAWQDNAFAALVSLTVPALVSPATDHLLELVYSTPNKTAGQSWWDGQTVCFPFQGLSLDAGATISAAAPTAGSFVCWGDSISVGANLAELSDPEYQGYDAVRAWPRLVADTLGYDYSPIAFPSQGVDQSGSGAPSFNDSWATLFNGVAALRNFTSAPPRFFVIAHGTNDRVGTEGASTGVFPNIVTHGVSVVNYLLGQTPSTTKIFWQVPLDQDQAANVRLIRSTCSDPTRVIVIETASLRSTRPRTR